MGIQLANVDPWILQIPSMWLYIVIVGYIAMSLVTLPLEDSYGQPVRLSEMHKDITLEEKIQERMFLCDSN